ncbi:AAA domain-containing protein [Mycoplasma sp. Ms02]|uniref:AAA domain-containing protein n=1 Tax=Mycoplasma sp. Ms02 TaxID=353851 RepID=UPI001C89CF26|nr:AAA domain-containing protein [Mycoplasma sp. Ms02]QZE12228.1 AAA family ATPase [Mycoplasma sp. Ms02]
MSRVTDDMRRKAEDQLQKYIDYLEKCKEWNQNEEIEEISNDIEDYCSLICGGDNDKRENNQDFKIYFTISGISKDFKKFQKNKCGFWIKFSGDLSLKKAKDIFVNGSVELLWTYYEKIFNVKLVSDRTEKRFKQEIFNLFKSKEKESDEDVFNSAIKLLASNSGSGDNVEIRYSKEKISEYTFYLEELKKAKKELDSEILIRYLSGEGYNRVNLDIRKEIENVYKVVSPEMYKNGRFPSDVKYAPYLMQQAAINIILDDKDRDLEVQSVNGPPGTGKTTLIKEVIASSITRQAEHLIEILDRGPKGMEDLPEKIWKDNILITSSNNSAVNNIVEELPKKANISEKFHQLAFDVDYFSNENQGYWALISAAGGRQANLDDLKLKLDNILEELDKAKFSIAEWVSAKNGWRSTKTEIDKIRRCFKRIKVLSDRNIIISKRILDINKEIESKESRLEDIYNDLDYVGYSEYIKNPVKSINSMLFKTKKSLLWSFFKIFSKNYFKNIKDLKFKKEKYLTLQKELVLITQNLDRLNNELSEKDAELKTNINDIETIKNKDLDSEGSYDNFYHLGTYEDINFDNPWTNERLRELQTKLFLESLRIRKLFLIKNKQFIKRIMTDKDNLFSDAKLFRWLNFIIPVISSTTASVQSMMKINEDTTDKKYVGHLIIDETGQVNPWALVGSIFRSKKVTAVGDPKQIEPIVNEGPEGTNLFESYNIKIGESAQTKFDQISKYGFQGSQERIGIPLWVHRRCGSPMFDICNELSYENNMVQGSGIKKSNGYWYDSDESDFDKIFKNLEFVISDIEGLQRNYKFENNDIFIITPFLNLKNRLKSHFIKKGCDKTLINNVIGTTHTFQGKETKVVIYVLGITSDPNSKEARSNKGSIRWVLGDQNPNIINVAVSRAKEVFAMLGSKKAAESIGKSRTTELLLKHLEPK